MPALSRAIALDAISVDPSLTDGLDKPCPACDPDNPKAVEKRTCQRCRGTGRVPLAAGEIASELAASGRGNKKRSPGSRRPRPATEASDDDADLYLEY